MAPSSQSLEPPQKPGRFTPGVTPLFESTKRKQETIDILQVTVGRTQHKFH